MDRRLYLLAFAGLVILGLVLFREQQQEYLRSLPPGARPLPRRSAAAFQLYDEHQPSQYVKFERYLGRTQLALVFFDDTLGLQGDPVIQKLLVHADSIAEHGVQIVAVSLATPSANRKAMQQLGLEKMPFPVLSDIDLHGPIQAPAHQLYGLYDEKTGQVRTGLFLIDRKQTLAMNPLDGSPYAVDDPLQIIEQLSQGNWPQEQFTQPPPATPGIDAQKTSPTGTP